MRTSQYIYSGLLAALVGTLSTGEASAHDFAAHDAIVRAATSAMHFWVDPKDGTVANFCPNPGELPPSTDANFAEYKRQVGVALQNLPKLRTGLDPVKFDTSGCNQTTNDDGSVTGYYPEDNLDNIGQFRIEDFRYVVERNYTTGCSMTALHDYTANQRLTNEKWRTLGSVLGTVAGDVDNRSQDTVLWIKPLNAGTWGLVKDALSLGVTVIGAVLLAPFACLWSFFSGSGDCTDAKKWAIKYNPVDFVAGIIPGIPYDFTGPDGLGINGVWHFEQTNSTGNTLTFANNPSGMWYPIAGPDLVPGALDVAIMAATSAAGVSLDARESWGVRDFGQFDEAGRYWTSWEAHALSNTEFTPVSKLAKYGVKEYNASGHMTAAKLGYPLHAFADATFPHHIANTSSWGHRPMEDAINNERAASLQFSTDNDLFNKANVCHRPVDLILEGYAWWKRYNLGQSGSHVDVEDAVESLASSTRDWVDDHSGVWSDTASLTYLVDKDDSVASYESDTYSGLSLADFAAPLEVHAVGATIAFLVDTGKDVANVQPDNSTKCEPGKIFYHNEGCQTPKPLILQPPTDLTIPAGVSCDPESGVCPAGMECVKAGPNANTCEVLGTIGTACGSSTDCKTGLGLVCADSGAEAGTCVLRNGTGDPCSSNTDCAAGFECATVGPNAGACELSGSFGTNCNSSNDCDEGLACAETGTYAGICVAKGTPGTNCTSNSGCNGLGVVCGSSSQCCIISWSMDATVPCQSASDCCPYQGSMEGVGCFYSQCGIIG